MSSERDVGLDDHKDTVVAVVAEAGSRAAERQGSWAGDESLVLKELKKLGQTLVVDFGDVHTRKAGRPTGADGIYPGGSIS